MRIFSLLVCMCCTAGSLACRDDAKTAQGTDVAEVFVPDTTPDRTPDATAVDTIASDTGAPDTAVPEVSDVADTAETIDTLEAVDTRPVETTPETVEPEVIDTAACRVPTMKDEYPGPFPSFPYGTWAHAEGCVANPHDVIIVLGCPSETDGSPSKCQIDRARITEQFYDAHWASNFIVTGAAVHNDHVEADALYALLVGRGLPADAIYKEPQARHTDENLYYSTRIMQEHGWTSALVVSEDPGHLMMTAVCDSNCCVDLGRLTLYEWEVEPDLYVKAGHYALVPPGTANTDAECTHISGLFMCINLGDREACKDDFQLSTP